MGEELLFHSQSKRALIDKQNPFRQILDREYPHETENMKNLYRQIIKSLHLLNKSRGTLLERCLLKKMLTISLLVIQKEKIFEIYQATDR